MEPIRIIVVKGLGDNISAVLTNRPDVEVLIENPEVYKCTATMVKAGNDKKCLYQTLVKHDPVVVNDFHNEFNRIHPEVEGISVPEPRSGNGNGNGRTKAEKKKQDY